MSNFKVGDRVRVTGYPNKKSKLIGKCGIIMSVGYDFIKVKLDDNYGEIYFCIGELEKIENC